MEFFGETPLLRSDGVVIVPTSARAPDVLIITYATDNINQYQNFAMNIRTNGPRLSQRHSTSGYTFRRLALLPSPTTVLRLEIIESITNQSDEQRPNIQYPNDRSGEHIITSHPP